MPRREIQQTKRIVGFLRRAVSERIGKPKQGSEIDFTKLDAEIINSLRKNPWTYQTGISPPPRTIRPIEHWIALNQMKRTKLSAERQRKLTAIILAIDRKSAPLMNSDAELSSEGMQFFEKLGVETTEHAYEAFRKALSYDVMVSAKYERWHEKRKHPQYLAKAHVLAYARQRASENYQEPILALYRNYLKLKAHR